MDQLYNKIIISGKNTYSLDVKEAKNQSKYLAISSSSPSNKEPDKMVKQSVLVFDNVIDNFVSTLKEASQVMKSESNFSKMIHSGKITYSVDVRESKKQNKYLCIASTRPSKEDAQKFIRQSIAVFDNAAPDFVGAVEESLPFLK
ncbi:MAG: DUF3276 family protein [Bacteroidota bacterium]